jgi:hypothetical protein
MARIDPLRLRGRKWMETEMDGTEADFDGESRIGIEG